MRALVVGAGAVGQVYGHHLARGGAHVSVFVRENHVAAARAGYALIRIHSKNDRRPARFVPDEVLTSAGEVEARTFHQAWLATPTPPLVRGDLDSVLSATRDATVVCLQPGMSVSESLARVVARERTVVGIIGMQSYVSPMEGSADPVERATSPGIAYFFPPLLESLFSGPGDRAAQVVDALRRGGAPARAALDVLQTSDASAAILVPIVAALEAASWSFDELGRTRPRRRARRRGLRAPFARNAATLLAP